MALTILSLFSGIGGLDLGVSRAVSARVVGHVERDPFAASVLLARMQDARLDPAPVWCGDLADFDPTPFVGVDLVTAGFPCQPASTAGKRAGTGDERWLWPGIAELLRIVGPSYVYLENVPGLLTVNGGDAFGEVLGSLAALGFDATWDLFRASAVGAPHRRERCFVLARRVSDARGHALRKQSERGEGRTLPAQRRDAQLADVLADADGRGWQGSGQPKHADEPSALGHIADRRGDDGKLDWPPGPQDAAGWELWVAARGPLPAMANPVRRDEPEVCASDGTEREQRSTQRRGAVEPAGSRAASRDHAGHAEDEALPGLRRDADGVPGGVDATGWMADRADRLRALGNSVVPQQAELAFRILWERLNMDGLHHKGAQNLRRRW